MQRVAKKADSLLNSLEMLQLPIDPSAIAKKLGIKVERAAFTEELSGVLMRGDGSAIIAINKTQPKVRQRFTIAHELGHYVLNHKGDMFVDHKVLNKRDGRSSIAIDPQEIEANAFAAALLMPQEMLLKELETILSQDQADIADRKALIAQLAKVFDVSGQAMEFRLVNLGLISAEV